jgi:hypothetical protein
MSAAGRFGINSATLGVLASMVACCDFLRLVTARRIGLLRTFEGCRRYGLGERSRDWECRSGLRLAAVTLPLSLDGVGEGFKESKKPHTLEFKTMNEKSFKATKSMGVKQSKPIYWAQCQLGMHLAGLDRCFFFAVNKNTDEIYGERIRLDKAEAKLADQ